MLQKQNHLHNLKLRFLHGEHIEADEWLSQNILDSWYRSKAAGVQAKIPTLPPAHSINKTSNARRISNFLGPFYSMDLHYKTKILTLIGAALFFLNEDSIVYKTIGSPLLLDELGKKNIGLFTSFKEEVVGTTAISLIPLKNTAVWVIGEEHYSDVFSEYACYGYQNCIPKQKDFYSSYFPFTSNMIFFLPIDKWNTLNKEIIEWMGMSYAQASYLANTPDVYVKNWMISNIYQDAVLITDINGLITGLNSSFCDIFHVCANDILATYAKEMFGNLFFFISATAKDQRKISNASVFLGNPLQEYYLDCFPIFKESECHAIVTTLKKAESVKKSVNRLTNPNARFTFDDIIGSSPAIINVKNRGHLAASSSSTILITGESGSGKEMFAQAIHNASERRNKPFIAINCSAIPKELIGSELFGYVEGAFTGAQKRGSLGKFELANTGTIFLDEVSEMPLEIQTYLLRVLEEKVVTRLGSNISRPINVRVIAASNRNLTQYVESKKFRLDLYYRLNVIHLNIPPLRERIDDLPILVNHIVNQLSVSLGKNVTGVSPDAINVLRKHDWPGNVRELRNVLECAINLEEGRTIQINSLPTEILVNGPNQGIHYASLHTKTRRVAANYKEIEAARAKELMLLYAGNKKKVASEMGISRGKLYSILNKINEWEY